MSTLQTLESILAAIRPGNIPPSHKVAMNEFRQEVCEFIQQRFPLHHERAGEPRRMGSKEKGTDIAQSYDLDLIVPFCFNYKNGPKGMKASLLHALQGHRYQFATKIRDQRVSIGLRREFVGHTLAIDIVPGMEKSLKSFNDNSAKEDDKDLILYDRESNRQRTTNIARQVRLIKEKMLHYRDVVRLLKAWRKKSGHPISSYALELLVYQAATAKAAPKTGSIDKLLNYTLQHAIPFLQQNGTLQDIGANYPWEDYLRNSGAKTQLAGLWKKLLHSLDQGSDASIRANFL